jgi:hypothetical protein
MHHYPTSASSSGSQTPAVITNPQSFAMPLPPGSHPHSHMPYPAIYGAPPPPPPGAQYPTAPYYQAPPYYYAQQPPATSSSQQHPATQAPAQAPSTSAQTAAATTQLAFTRNGREGAWSAEEEERLKKLAEESRAAEDSNQKNGEIDWDWVIGQWGFSRTRSSRLSASRLRAVC